MEQIELELTGVDSADKKKEIRTIRLMEKHYSEEFFKVNSFDPTSRRTLIEQLLKGAKNNGISDSMIISNTNVIISNVGLSPITDASYSYICVNGSIGDLMVDVCLIISVNELFSKFGLENQYSAMPMSRNSSAFAVPLITTELSSYENDAVKMANLEKLKEKVLMDFVQLNSDSAVVLDAIRSIDTIAEYLGSQPRIPIAKLYENYSILYSKLEHALSKHGGVITAHRKLLEADFERVFNSLKSGEGYNVPTEIRVFIAVIS